MSYLELLKLAAPECILVLSALVLLVLGSRNYRGACTVFALLGILAAVAAALVLSQTVVSNADLTRAILRVSPLTTVFSIICLLFAFATILLARDEVWLRHLGEYQALILFATVGLLILIRSAELLTIFIGLELLGLSLYVLTAFDKNDIRSAEAGLKYFLFGSTASAFTLFGISLVYGISGTTTLTQMHLADAPLSPLLAAGIVMTLIGFAFKIAAAPFHLWAPDAYEAAPVASAAFIASASKVASFVVLGNIVLSGFAPVGGSADWHGMIAGWKPILAVLAAFSILLGNFVALAQTHVRRLLAYSAVAHAGYTLLGLIADGRQGFAATLFYITIYGATLLGAFGVCAVVRHETGGDTFADFAGLRARSPLLAGSMAVFMLSLAGLPPLAGFFGKFYLFSAAYGSGPNHGLLWLVAVALFGSLISLYYYLVILKAIFIDEATHPQKVTSMPRMLPRITVATLALAVVFLGLVPTPLLARILAATP